MTGTGATRLAVIGDVDGRADRLAAALVALGADLDRAALPGGLAVVQLGGLVRLDADPGAPSAVSLADRFMKADPARWTQLAGNAEYRIVHSAPDDVDPTDRRRLCEWWDAGSLPLTAAFDLRHPGPETQHASGDFRPTLVSHAGLTIGVWQRLGRPTDASSAARSINVRRTDPDSAVSHTVARGNGQQVDLGAGVLVADACSELTSGWLVMESMGLVQLPFDQVHGRHALYDWHLGAWRCSIVNVRRATQLDRHHGVTRTAIGGSLLWGCASSSPAAARPVVFHLAPGAGGPGTREH